MAKLTANMFKLLKEPLQETLPPYIAQQHHLMSYNDAVRNIHYPSSPEALRHAQLRLKFEELFYVQLNILRYVKDRQLRYRGIVFDTIGGKNIILFVCSFVGINAVCEMVSSTIIYPSS